MLITCSSCKYFNKLNHADQGECRIQAPTKTSTQFESHHGWPYVSNKDWCGDWAQDIVNFEKHQREAKK